jgi:O-antigen/teichoic acid export membrane protein
MSAPPEVVLAPGAQGGVGAKPSSVGRLSRLAAAPGIVSLADQGVASATSFLTGVILGRALSREEFGLYMLGLTVVGLASDLQACVVATPYTIRSPQLRAPERARYSASALVHQLGIILVFMVGVSVAARILPRDLGAPGLASTLAALGLAGGGTLLWYYARSYLFANLRMRGALVLDSALFVLQLGGLLALAQFGWLTTPRAFGVVGIAGGLAAAVILSSARGAFHLAGAEVWPDFRRSWQSGRWILASAVVWSLGNQLYPWLLAAFHGTGAAGAWAACLGIVGLVNPALLGLQNSFGPRIAHAYADGGALALRAATRRALATFAVLVAPFAAGALLLGGPATRLVYGSQYAETGAVVGTLALNTLLLALAFPLSRALFVAERANVDFAINLLGIVLMLTLGVFLVRSLGALGAAATLLMGNAAGLVLRYAAFRRAVSRSL